LKKVAVITGVTSGIGQALAGNLARKNIQVIGIGRRQEKIGDLAKAFPGIQLIQSDVSKPTSRMEIIRALSDYKQIHFLVHNAGTMVPVGNLQDISLDDWRNIMSINLEPALFLTQAFLPKLTNGRILQISAGIAHHPLVGMGAYSVSKAALYMLFLNWREEFKGKEVQIGSVNPGINKTEIQSPLLSLPHENKARQLFEYLKKQDKLLNPHLTAKFLAWMLLEMDDKTFSEKEHLIYDDWHHNFWLSEDDPKPVRP